MNKNTERKMYAVREPNGFLANNILEISEAWAWAIFYSRRKYRLKVLPPSKIPQDAIQAFKEQGYGVIPLVQDFDF